MIVSIHQPAYLPWLGYFSRIAHSDVHVVLDHVQFEKNSYTNRNRIRMGARAHWLTVPVLTKGKFGNLVIRDLRINEQVPWPKKHWRTLEQAYRSAPFFPRYAEELQTFYDRPWSRLLDLCSSMREWFLRQLSIDTHVVYSSELHPTATKSDLVLELCVAVGATTYLSGALGRTYLDEEAFAAAGIDVVYQDYDHPVYPQHGYENFMSHLAVVDLLFNAGPESAGILRAGDASLAGLR